MVMDKTELMMRTDCSIGTYGPNSGIYGYRVRGENTVNKTITSYYTKLCLLKSNQWLNPILLLHM
jgi:hypothetical protein